MDLTSWLKLSCPQKSFAHHLTTYPHQLFSHGSGARSAAPRKAHRGCAGSLRRQEQISERICKQIVEQAGSKCPRHQAETEPWRFGKQTIESPAISLAERVVEASDTRTQDKTQHVVNTHVQHVVNTVEVERPKLAQETVQDIKIPQVQFLDKVDEIPVVAQRQIPIVVQTSHSCSVLLMSLLSVAQAPQMQIAEKTVEISQLQAAEKIMLLETRETQTIQGIQTSESLKPDDPDVEIKFFVEEELHGVAGPVFDANGNRVANELGGRNCVTGEMRKNKLPSRLDLDSIVSDDTAWPCKHYTGLGVRKHHESGTALVEDSEDPVLKMPDSIEAHYQTSLKTAKNPNGEPYPAFTSDTWDEASGKTVAHRQPSQTPTICARTRLETKIGLSMKARRGSSHVSRSSLRKSCRRIGL